MFVAGCSSGGFAVMFVKDIRKKRELQLQEWSAINEFASVVCCSGGMNGGAEKK